MGFGDIPNPIKSIFDTFPLKTYGPITNTTKGNEDYLESKRCYFINSKEGEQDPLNSFSLGVYGVYDYKERVIATDPVSLNQQLVLCYKNELRLPRCDKIHFGKSDKDLNSIFTLSYHGSSTGELPIMVENSGSKRIIRGNLDLNVQNYKSSALVNEFLDSQVYDLWIMMLLVEKRESLLSVYDESYKSTDSILDNLVIDNLIKNMVNWNGFKDRHSTCFTKYSIDGIIWDRLKKQYANNFKIFDIFLSNLDLENGYIGDEFELIDIKMASYLKSISFWGVGTDACKVLSKYNSCEKYYVGVLDRFL